MDSRSSARSGFRLAMLIGAGILTTLLAVGLAFLARSSQRDAQPLAPEFLPTLSVYAYWIGHFVQVNFVPIGLFYFVTTTRAFREAVGDAQHPRGSSHLRVGLAAIQVVSLTFHMLFSMYSGEPLASGLLLVSIGALVGGWRAGVGLGLLTLLFHGTEGLLRFSPILDIYRNEGWQGILASRPAGLLLHEYVLNPWMFPALWAGILTGIAAEVLGTRRFAMLPAAGLGVGIEAGAIFLMAVGGIPPGTFLLIPSVLVTAMAMVAASVMIRSVRADVRRQQAEAAALALARAELRALRAQINPHFLFNALNTIRYFVRTEPEVARRLLLDLSEVFQRVLRSGEFIPLRDELDYVRAYLALEQARLNTRLQMAWPDPPAHLLETSLPALILQPVVENAILHGIGPKVGGGTVSIAVEQRGDALLLEVQDDGVGIAADRLAEILSSVESGDATQSIGLHNVDRRLRALYGNEYHLVIESEPGQGTRVRLRIPIQPAKLAKESHEHPDR